MISKILETYCVDKGKENLLVHIERVQLRIHVKDNVHLKIFAPCYNAGDCR